MGLFDNILSDAQQKLSQAQNDVQSYLQKKISEPLVKVGALPMGNLSEAQIRAGMRGTPAPIAPPAAAPVTIARSQDSGVIAAMPMGLSMPILVGLGLVAFLVFKRKG